jgi:hypothetical protein
VTPGADPGRSEPSSSRRPSNQVGVGWSLRGDPVLAANLHGRESDGRKAYWDSLDEDEWYKRVAEVA